MKFSKGYYLILYLILSTNFFAQKSNKNIEENIHLFIQYFDNSPEKAFNFINCAYTESKKVKNDSLIARSANNLGLYYYSKNDLIKAKKYYNESILFSKKVNYYKILSSSYNEIASIFVNENQYNKALKTYHSALNITEKHNLSEIKSRILINLGNLYLTQKDTTKSISYFKSNISNSEKNNLQDNLAIGYMNLAVLLTKNNPEESEKLLKKSLEILKTNKDLYIEFLVHINFSNLYLDNKKRQEKVFFHLQKAKKTQEKIGDQSILFYYYFNLGAYYLNTKQYEKAIEYYNLANNFNDIPSDKKMELYEAMYEIYFIQKNYKEALFFNNKHKTLSDSLYSIEKSKAFSEIQTKYEVDKKNLKIEILTKEKEIQKNKTWIIISLGLSLLLPLIIMIFSYRSRMKTQKIIAENNIKIHKHELEKIEQEQAIKSIQQIVEMKDQERDRIALEIHDGIGSSLSGIKFQLEEINIDLKNKKIDKISKQLTNNLIDIRTVSHNLSLNYLTDKSLENLVIELVNQYQKSNTFAINLYIFPSDCLNFINNKLTHQLYRIIQELMNNVVKHANATSVVINITKIENELIIVIEDNGVGFSNTKINGIGLKNISQRLKTINATITIDSEPNKHTIIQLNIPST